MTYPQPPAQHPQPPTQYPERPTQPTYPLSPPLKSASLLNLALILIIVGGMLIGTGTIVASFFGSDVTVENPQSGDDGFSMDIGVTPVKVGLILIGIGVMLEGVGSAFAVKARYEQRRELGVQRIS